MTRIMEIHDARVPSKTPGGDGIAVRHATGMAQSSQACGTVVDRLDNLCHLPMHGGKTL